MQPLKSSYKFWVRLSVGVIVGFSLAALLLRPAAPQRVAKQALECLLDGNVECVVNGLDPDEKQKLGLTRAVQEAVVREVLIPGYRRLPILKGEGGIEGGGRLVAWWLPLKTKKPSRLFVGAVTDDGSHYFTSLSFLVAGLHRAEETIGREIEDPSLVNHDVRFQKLRELGFAQFYNSENGNYQEFRE